MALVGQRVGDCIFNEWSQLRDDLGNQIFIGVLYWCWFYEDGLRNRLGNNAYRCRNYFNNLWSWCFCANSNETGFTCSSFLVSIFICSVFNGDQGSKWVNIAVFTSYNIRISCFLMFNVGLFVLIGYLVFKSVCWIRLKMRKDLFIY